MKKRCSTQVLYLIMGLLTTLPPVVARGQPLIHDGTIINRPGKWDGYPTHIFDEGKHRIWFCSQGPTNNDQVRFTEKSGPLSPGGWTNSVVVLSHENVAWADHHVCDPAALRFNRSYAGQNYKYVLYFTADTGGQSVGVENKIGVAFSNNRISWNVHPEPVLSFWLNLVPPHLYGAGMSGIAFDPWTLVSTPQGLEPVIQHVYWDSSFSTYGEERVRYRSTYDGVNWFFSTSTPGETSIGTTVNVGHNPDVAYRHDSGAIRWYATVTDFTDESHSATRVQILRSAGYLGSFGGSDPWEVIGTIDAGVTGNVQNNNPGFAKHSDGRLYESGGKGYVHFATGSGNATSWRINQVRFDP